MKHALALSALALAVSQAVYAQEATVAEPAGKADQETAATLGEVKVTGRAVSSEDESKRTYATGAATVTGKVPLKQKEIPNSVSVITRKRMDDQNLVTMGDAMQQVTGINVVNNDNMNNQYFARGYGMSVMYDGVASYNGMTPSHQFDLPLYERIEVLRGPSGLMRGSGEPGGVVNMVKKRPRSTPAASIVASAGSWNNYRLEGDVTGALNADKSLRGRIIAADEDRKYFFDHTHSKKWLGSGMLEYDFTSQTSASLSFSAQDHDVQAPYTGIPAYRNLVDPNNGVYPLMDVARSTYNVPDWNRMRYQTKETTLGLEHKFDNQWLIKTVVNHRKQYRNYKYAYVWEGVDPTANTVKYQIMQGDDDYTRDGADIFANGPFVLLGRTHNLLVGYNAELYWNLSHSGRSATINNVTYGDLTPLAEQFFANTSGSESETRQSGLYSQARFSITDPLTLMLGARTTTFKIKTRNVAPSAQTAWKDGAKANNQLTPFAGLVYDLSKEVSLYTSYSDIFVPQTQLKADGSTLDPRTGRQYELGSKGEFFDGELQASLAWFNIRDKNRLYADPAYPTQSFFLNAGEVESKGWELEASGKPLPRLDVMVGYTRLMTRYLADRPNNTQGTAFQGKTYSIQTPEHQFKVWGNYRCDEAGVLSGFSIGLGMQANSAAQSTRGWRDQLLNPGYAVVNGNVAYQIDKKTTLTLQVNNLFDRKYYASVGTPSNYNFYGEPRNYNLVLRANY